MKSVYKTVTTVLILFSLMIHPSLASSKKGDFIIDTDTEFSYTTGNDYVTVKTEYIREVLNKNYYLPAQGERIFHLPDASATSQEKVNEEREYKLSTLKVVNELGTPLKYEVEQLNIGEGIYIKVGNYRDTTVSSPYHVTVTYNTHDYVLKAGNYITIVGTSLPKDIKFEEVDENNGTTTYYNYYFRIVTDKNIPPLSKIFPKFSKSENSSHVYYEFAQTDRIENAPVLEFGTNATYKFELSYTTPKTDNMTPTVYSDIFQSVSTNIYELSLPREFSETNQHVYFENVSPLPKRIHVDSEGNLLATFEVPANKESNITITGYITVQQNEYEKQNNNALSIELTDYYSKIQQWSTSNTYLRPTKFWQSTDQYIVQIANSLLKDQATLLDVIKADYKFVGDTLEYDDEKANSDNTRIGAVAALSGGKSVCMEYADSLIAILRAQGIPARAALGYTNIVDQSVKQIRHQWVQIWVPDYGWLSVDPTFESENMKIGPMIDRILWETFNGDSLSNIMIYSADKLQNLSNEGFSLTIYSAEETFNPANLMTYTDLLKDQPIESAEQYRVSYWLDTLLKATVLGRAILITIPVIICVLVVVIIITIIKEIRRKIKTKNIKRQLTNKDQNANLLRYSENSKK